ncbi:hypothetical protein K2173_010402 [Erythroxylum novogranatense]|uniref:Glutaredoxin domain-containing protein n=1 Tax=Erythroxylum novogranatense TaxID=1862640 RepID=A0AAV8TDK1_9ROSI|nr:hypothetical protein K2173_010402 [Erythroxylum novogranatense]
MGCVSSNLLSNDDEFTQLGSTALGHHIVSLTSTTYGLLNLDPPPPPQPSATTTPPTPATCFTPTPNPLPQPTSLCSDPKPEIIDSWELMSGLDTDSFRFSPAIKRCQNANKENSNPNLPTIPKTLNGLGAPKHAKERACWLDRFERLCPPNGENRVVIYTTTLRGIRKTFEACNVVRAAIERYGVVICERDVSMDRGFREELRELMRGKQRDLAVPPRVFVKGCYVGGAEEVMNIVEEGWMGKVLEGLPRKLSSEACEGCGDVRFLPCFSCNGSSKMVMVVKESDEERQGRSTVVVRCPDCNENGLVLCPICS